MQELGAQQQRQQRQAGRRDLAPPGRCMHTAGGGISDEDNEQLRAEVFMRLCCALQATRALAAAPAVRASQQAALAALQQQQQQQQEGVHQEGAGPSSGTPVPQPPQPPQQSGNSMHPQRQQGVVGSSKGEKEPPESPRPPAPLIAVELGVGPLEPAILLSSAFARAGAAVGLAGLKHRMQHLKAGSPNFAPMAWLRGVSDFSVHYLMSETGVSGLDCIACSHWVANV